MKTIRRIYFYLVAAISVEVMVWGVINLLRSIIHAGIVTDSTQNLSMGLAQVVVSIPIFLIHWLVIQKDAGKSEEEQSSLLRAMFLYGIELGMLVPVVQNLLAAVIRQLLDVGGSSRMTALLGQSQSLTDNLIAVVINLLFAYYFHRILTHDWKVSSNTGSLVEMQRIYRYFWSLYGLGMTLLGVQMLITFLLPRQAVLTADPLAALVNPLSLIVLGLPIWVVAWMSIQSRLDQAEERYSGWRVGILYVLALGAAICCAAAGIFILDRVLRILFGTASTLQQFIWDIRAPISLLVPMGVVWAYHQRQLFADIDSRADVFTRQAMKRVYNYLLSLMGLGFTVTALIMLLQLMVRILLTRTDTFHGNEIQIAQGIGLLAVGVAFWLIHFIPENQIALAEDEAGEHARRSLIRKIYLYVVVFAGVVGVMATGGVTIYIVLQGLFEANLTTHLTDILIGIGQVIVFGVFLGYHLTNLGRDARATARGLQAKHAVFPVGIGFALESNLSREISLAFARHAASIPVEFIPAGELTAEKAVQFQALVLPATVPDAEWRTAYTGRIISVPEDSDAQLWIPSPGKPAETAKSLALLARTLAEGRPAQPVKSASVWMIVGYVFAGLIALQLILALLGSLLRF